MSRARRKLGQTASRASTSSVTPAMKHLLRKRSPDGYVAATGKYEVPVADKMVEAGLLRRQHGLVYELTQRGMAAADRAEKEVKAA